MAVLLPAAVAALLYLMRGPLAEDMREWHDGDGEYRHDVDHVDLPRYLVFKEVGDVPAAEKTTLTVSLEGMGFEYGYTATMFKEDLFEIFSIVGDVERVRVYKGEFATVTFWTARGARAAMDLNGAPLDDRLGSLGAGGGTLRVQWGVPDVEEKRGKITRPMPTG